MKSFITGGILTAVGLFVFGAIYWMNPLPFTAAHRAPDQAALGAVLREQLPASGTYLLPHPGTSAEGLEELSLAGPIATIHLLREGRPSMEPRVLLFGFLHGLVAVLLTGVLMTISLRALPTYGSRVRFAVLLGVMVTLFTRMGDVIWWRLPQQWQMVLALYDILAFLVIGLLLGAFIKPRSESARTSRTV